MHHLYQFIIDIKLSLYQSIKRHFHPDRDPVSTKSVETENTVSNKCFYGLKYWEYKHGRGFRCRHFSSCTELLHIIKLANKVYWSVIGGRSNDKHQAGRHSLLQWWVHKVLSSVDGEITFYSIVIRLDVTKRDSNKFSCKNSRWYLTSWLTSYVI